MLIVKWKLTAACLPFPFPKLRLNNDYPFAYPAWLCFADCTIWMRVSILVKLGQYSGRRGVFGFPQLTVRRHFGSCFFMRTLLLVFFCSLVLCVNFFSFLMYELRTHRISMSNAALTRKLYLIAISWVKEESSSGDKTERDWIRLIKNLVWHVEHLLIFFLIMVAFILTFINTWHCLV